MTYYPNIIQGPSLCIIVDADEPYEDPDGIPNMANRAVYWLDNSGFEWGLSVAYELDMDDIPFVDKQLRFAYEQWCILHPELIREEDDYEG